MAQQQEFNIPNLTKGGKLGIGGIILGLILLVVVFKSSITIGYGEAGVLFKTFGGGVVTDEDPLGEGFHIIAPWNKVFKYNTKQQELFQKEMKVLSSNGLEIKLDISVLYQPQIGKLGKLHQTKGTGYVNNVIIPEIRAVARSVVGRYTPEQLYSINNSSLKDAIVSFGGFCTGEIISKDGLILTNHHCGYEAIQTHSSVENDYLTDGFWAMSHKEEKPNEGLFVRFLVRMEDVTSKILPELGDDLSEDDRAAKIAELGKKISDEAIDGTGYTANVKSFYHGNEFYMFVYETYNDVRLVGAPPSSVGKFGGDTDNWMWPRHTGDFSMFRVYTDADGKPAKYSEDNIPMKPKHHLPISLDGVKEGDFTMIFGYPGSTDRYLSSYGVKQAVDKHNPAVVKIRDIKLDIMKKYMSESDKVRIQYASKQSRVSNYWKYYIGQTEQLNNNGVYDKKLAIENDFAKWVNADASRQKKYGKTLNLFKESYAESDAYVESDVYVLEAGLTGADITLLAFRFSGLMNAYFATEDKLEADLKAEEDDAKKADITKKAETRLNAIKEAIKSNAADHFKNYNTQLDKERFADLLQLYYDNVAKEQQPEFFRMVEKKFKGDFSKFADKTFEKSILVSMERIEEYLEKPNRKKLKKDYAVIAGSEFISMYRATGKKNKANEPHNIKNITPNL